MAERRSTRHKRCPLCKIQQSLCFCSEIKTFSCQTSLKVIIHQKEKFLPSNTVNLLQRNFPNLKIYTRGAPLDSVEVPFEISKDHHPLFLYPDEDSIELNQELLESIKKPIELIIPDGTWRQAKKMKRREPMLKDIQTVKISGNYKSIYTLRKQKYEYGLSTYEAVAKALEVIESKELADQMLSQFKLMNDRFHNTRPVNF